MNEQIQYLPHTQLEIHPRNMRRRYPPADVQAMADSIREHGVILPLIAIRDPATGQLYVVAGNLRLTAVRSLGDQAPEVPVVIRERTDDQQMLDMAIENAMRFQPDPVSEGLHYKRIIAQDGMNVNRLHKVTGIAPATIHNRLAWAALEPEIQKLCVKRQLPKQAAEHLIQVPAGPDRVALAKRFVRSRTTARGIQRGVRRYLDELGLTKAFEGDSPDGRAVALAHYLPAARHQLRGAVETKSDLRLAAAEACRKCSVRDDLGVPEPAWAILAHGAAEACDRCGLHYLREVCIDCPLVTCLRHAYRDMARANGKVPHETF